jgi:succinate dehydrogenase / fumarate reductase iron-sulfur subunit
MSEAVALRMITREARRACATGDDSAATGRERSVESTQESREKTMADKTLRITLTAWRQAGPDAAGAFETYDVPGVSPDMSFLEMLDTVNERLILDGKEPIAFDHDCREGICGSCGMMINGVPHGPERGTATCQLHMRKFADGDHVTIEPWRAASFPLVRDLIVDRGTFDRIIEAGGYVTSPVGGAPDGNLIPIPKGVADAAMDAAACIGCGACVAACPNGAAQLFTAAKLQHLNLMPQGQAERWDRTVEMVETMEMYFGSCTNHRECEAACPKSISIDFIALMNRDYAKAQLKQRRLVGQQFP